ncbi:MAG: hypothetical protein IT337_11035 [Thermomicrobiales bacterium]|nr:hypothetical protein [Thermomicrobiales bacterium]
MISLRKYLYARPPGPAAGPGDAGEEFCQALASLAGAVLDAIEAHVFVQSHPRARVYPEEFGKVRRSIESDPAPGELRAAGLAVARLLEAHQHTMAELDVLESAEVQQIVSMLNQTIAALSAGSDRSVERLRQIEGDLKHATAIPDIVALKARLSDTLRYVREASVRERSESAETAARLARDAQRAQERMAAARSGVGGREEAELRIQAMCQRPVRGALAVFVLDRAEAIRQRFGGTVADRYVFLFVQDLLDALPSPKQLFLWDTSAIVADLESESHPDALRAELRAALAAAPAERRLDIGQRLAVFSNHHRWTVIPLGASDTPAETVARVERAVAG